MQNRSFAHLNSKYMAKDVRVFRNFMRHTSRPLEQPSEYFCDVCRFLASDLLGRVRLAVAALNLFDSK
jgi:hypothetical protein